MGRIVHGETFMNTRRSFTIMVLIVALTVPALADETRPTLPGGRVYTLQIGYGGR